MRTPVSGLRGKARIEARRAWQPAAWAGIDGRGSGGQRSPARASFRDTQASLQKKRAASGLGLGLRGQGGGQAAEPRSPQLPGFLDVEAEAGCLWSCSGRASRWAECSPAARGKTPKQPWPRERLVPEPQERLMFHLSSLQGPWRGRPKVSGRRSSAFEWGPDARSSLSQPSIHSRYVLHAAVHIILAPYVAVASGGNSGMLIKQNKGDGSSMTR